MEKSTRHIRSPHTHNPWSSLGRCILVFSFLAVLPSTSHSQRLEELKHSELYRKFDLDGSDRRPDPKKGASGSTEILTNYDFLWSSKQAARLLLQWSETTIPNHRLSVVSVGLNSDCAQAIATLENREKIEVSLVIQVPKPMYTMMATHQTLESFNRFRPPALDVVGSQKVDMHGVQADFFRHRDGPCSLLIPIARQGIINLSVQSCTQSAEMFEVAKMLNVTRLNEKLTS